MKVLNQRILNWIGAHSLDAPIEAENEDGVKYGAANQADQINDHQRIDDVLRLNVFD